MVDQKGMQTILLEDPQTAEQLYGFSGGLLFRDFTKDRADEHWVIIDGDNRIHARCSLWYKEKILFEGKLAGFIGHYDAVDEEVAALLLNHAFAQLRLHNCALAIGPMDGNTWRRYRFITDRGKERVFFLEPDNPDEYVQHFLLSGFRPVAQYFSALNKDLAVRDPKADVLEGRFKAKGISLRPFSAQNSNPDLASMFQLSLQSFKSNFLYSPITEDEFMEKYQPLLRMIKANSLLIAEDNGKPVGFVLALPDYNEGPQPETMVLKTVARLPESKYAGLGRYLVDRVQKEAFINGYRRVIHALMLDQNVSGKISLRYASPVRKYTLYSRQLSS